MSGLTIISQSGFFPEPSLRADSLSLFKFRRSESTLHCVCSGLCSRKVTNWVKAKSAFCWFCVFAAVTLVGYAFCCTPWINSSAAPTASVPRHSHMEPGSCRLLHGTCLLGAGGDTALPPPAGPSTREKSRTLKRPREAPHSAKVGGDLPQLLPAVQVLAGLGRAGHPGSRRQIPGGPAPSDRGAGAGQREDQDPPGAEEQGPWFRAFRGGGQSMRRPGGQRWVNSVCWASRHCGAQGGLRPGGPSRPLWAPPGPWC